MAGFERSRIVGLSEKDLDEFTCGICQEIFNNPYVTQCCRQTYCKHCIEEWLTTGNTCPNDRKPLCVDNLIPAPRFAINFLNNMQIRCEFYEMGCPFITSIAELSKHLDVCDHKPEINCKTCGVFKGEDHNCIANLINRSYRLEVELERLQQKNQELNETMTLGMSAVLESARNSVHQYLVIEQDNINLAQSNYIIDECIEAILGSNSYRTLCVRLSRKINQTNLCHSKSWHAIAFSSDGGSSNISVDGKGDHFFSIKFNMLNIELFTLKN